MASKYTIELSDPQIKFVKTVQNQMENDKNVRLNKSQTIAKIIDYAIKNNIDLKEIIR